LGKVLVQFITADGLGLEILPTREKLLVQ